jgi:hypothetical protein
MFVIAAPDAGGGGRAVAGRIARGGPDEDPQRARAREPLASVGGQPQPDRDGPPASHRHELAGQIATPEAHAQVDATAQLAARAAHPQRERSRA